MSAAELVLSILAAVLLAGPAGLNPYLPLLVAAVMSMYSGRFPPQPAYDFLRESWFVASVSVLFVANIFLDKIFVPGDSLATPANLRDRRVWIGTIHDLGQMLLGPLSAALLMGASDCFFPPSWPLMAPILGAFLGALIYVGKRTLRHRLAGRFGPLTNLLLSILEDLIAVLVCAGGILLAVVARAP